jgi:DNA-binding NtrC family response regulator
VVIASQSVDDRLSLRMICALHDFTLFEAGSCREALLLAGRHRVAVVICEWDLPGGGWKAVLEGLAKLSQCPQVIVASRLADHYLWADVLDLGGYDVLITPFEAKEVSRVVSLAWCSSQRGRTHAADAGKAVKTEESNGRRPAARLAARSS